MGSTASVPHRTFRDPAGSVEVRDGGVFRSVRVPYAAEILDFLQTPLAVGLVADRLFVASEVSEISGFDSETLVLQHPRISFVSYPWEWPSALWLAAAELTLDLSSRLVAEGWVLKDATPLNILFEGNKPIFVDVLSVERMEQTSGIWLPYGQFVRTFVLPLLAHTQLGWPLQTAQTRRDGFEPEEIYAALPWSRRLRQPSRNAVTLPTLISRLLHRQTGLNLAQRSIEDPEITRHMLLKTFKNLRKATRQAVPVPRSSAWSDYAETAGHYSEADHAEKQAFVSDALRQCRPAKVLDVGCNTGVYSRIAAATGAEVVSIDTDMSALERFCQQLKSSDANILPLCVDLAYPSPATGWENRESISFLDRCEGHFDTVLMLAVLHHLLLSAQIPLGHIAALCSRITTRNLILEWVPPTDSKFIEILRGREAIYQHITEAALRSAFSLHFDVANEASLCNGRILFHMVKH